MAEYTKEAAQDEVRDPQKDLRLRAAWLYYVDGLTQSDVAKALGVNRVMITRALAEARSRGEVTIRIQSDIATTMRLQRDLEAAFSISSAVVAPYTDPNGDPTRAIAAAAGALVSDLIGDGMTIGVGWGRTLQAMLPHVVGHPTVETRVVSLLGGISQARRFNPAEFAWQFAELFNAEGYLIPAPALVDSPQTRHALLERCGLEQILQMAETCNIALLSCGGISSLTTSYRVGHVSEAERASMVDAGVIGDILYNFVDAEGRLVDHPINARSIAMPVHRLKRIPQKILISGGPEKTAILHAVLRSLEPDTFVTDEMTARRLLGQDLTADLR